MASQCPSSELYLNESHSIGEAGQSSPYIFIVVLTPRPEMTLLVASFIKCDWPWRKKNDLIVHFAFQSEKGAKIFMANDSSKSSS